MSTSSSSTGLRRSLSLLDLTAIGLNATVGSGIFLLPDDLFREMGAWSPFAFLLCALALLPVAWCFADAARRTQVTGGPYEYARQELGDFVGSSVGWMCFVNAVFSFAAVASAAAAYAGHLLPVLSGDGAVRGMALFAIAAFGLLNFVGAKPGAWAIRLFTFGKFAVLLLLISVLLPDLAPGRPDTMDPTAMSPRSISSAVFMALFALQGFEVVGVPAGEAHSPERKVPFAVFATLSIASGLYILVQGVLVLGFPGISKQSDAPLADAALALSPSLGVLVAVGALISTLGFVSGSALGTPRYLFAMASHRQLPIVLSRLHPEFRTPSVAILATSVIAALLVLPFDYRTLIGMSNVAVAVQYGATCVAVLRQRIKSREAAHRNRHLILAALGVLVSVSIWFAATWQELAFSAVALIVGWILMCTLGRPPWPPRAATRTTLRS